MCISKNPAIITQTSPDIAKAAREHPNLEEMLLKHSTMESVGRNKGICECVPSII